MVKEYWSPVGLYYTSLPFFSCEGNCDGEAMILQVRRLCHILKEVEGDRYSGQKILALTVLRVGLSSDAQVTLQDPSKKQNINGILLPSLLAYKACISSVSSSQASLEGDSCTISS